MGRTATATTISNCINFGERGCNGGTVPLNHSGVATVTDSGSLTISNCINAGPYVNSNSASIAIARFLNKTIPDMAQEYIDKLPKDGEWEKVIEKLPTSLNQVLEIAKEDGNADIIRGALKMGEE